MGFLSPRPNVSTGLSTVMTWSDPGGLGGTPKAIKRIQLQFAPGTRFDTSAVTSCGASDLEIFLEQAAACPAASRIGGGSTIGAFVTGQTFTTQVTLFNAPGQIIVLVTVGGLPATEFRDDVHEDSITINPALPAAVTLERLALRIDAHSAGPKSYMRTPPGCPASGQWPIAATFYYADGSSERHDSGSGCVSPRRRQKRRHHHRRPSDTRS
jgi:hypothetical protein